MKGIIFTEFLELVEDKFGFEMTDKIITNSNLPSGGTYTSIGTYDHMEMISLVTELSKESKVPVPDLLYIYGKHLFGRFPLHYPQFFENAGSALDFLQGIEEYIHTEVRKLYPDAELPYFDTNRITDNTLEMLYKSKRNMPEVAHGLIEGCLIYFKTEGKIVKEAITEGTKFTITV